jgi:hypothetical protein
VSIYAEEERGGLVQSDVVTDAESEGKQQSIRVRQECWPAPLEVAFQLEGHPWKCDVVATLGRR